MIKTNQRLADMPCLLPLLGAVHGLALLSVWLRMIARKEMHLSSGTWLRFFRIALRHPIQVVPGMLASMRSGGRICPEMVNGKSMNLKQIEVNMRFPRHLEKRFQLFQKQLLDKNRECQEESDRTHLSNEFVFQVGLQNQRLVRDVNQIPLLHEYEWSAHVRAVS
jgi:hypothetical protein